MNDLLRLEKICIIKSFVFTHKNHTFFINTNRKKKKLSFLICLIEL